MTSNEIQLTHIVQEFEKPFFYQHPVSYIDRRETHISVVFLTGDLVYKIKKPVNFGFLNYETPELRRFYCHQEVRLNQRLTKDIYLKVAQVCRDEQNGRLFLGECDHPIEHVVVMKELPEQESLGYLLAHNQADSGILTQIGSHLAQFYKRASVYNPHFTKYGGIEYVRFNAYENVQQLQPFADHIGGLDFLLWLKKAIYRFTVKYRRLFDERVRNGYIVDGHGDLRAEHIYVHNGIQVLDCIEFNDRLRFGDVAVDLAFLFMDLCRLGFEEEAFQIIDHYCVRNKDFQLWGLLDFYTAYRALVRAKVACLETLSYASGQQEGVESAFKKARQFMKIGTEHTMAYDVPTVIIFMGLPASGKTKLASYVRDYFHWEYLSTDQVRKNIEPEASISPFGEGSYTEERRSKVYEVIAEKVAECVARGCSVVVDGTFSKRKWRKLFQSVFDGRSCYLFFAEAMASENVVEERLLAREQKNEELSDARIEHLRAFSKSYESPNEISPDCLIVVSTDEEIDHSLAYLTREFYRKRWAFAREIT